MTTMTMMICYSDGNGLAMGSAEWDTSCRDAMLAVAQCCVGLQRHSFARSPGTGLRACTLMTPVAFARGPPQCPSSSALRDAARLAVRDCAALGFLGRVKAYGLAGVGEGAISGYGLVALGWTDAGGLQRGCGCARCLSTSIAYPVRR